MSLRSIYRVLVILGTLEEFLRRDDSSLNILRFHTFYRCFLPGCSSLVFIAFYVNIGL